MYGVNIIVFMHHLHDLIRHYEIGGHFAELSNLFEQGINLDRAHPGIYTQLGIYTTIDHCNHALIKQYVQHVVNEAANQLYILKKKL